MSLTKTNLYLLDPRQIKFRMDEEQELILEDNNRNQKYEEIEVNPAFPLSEFGRFLAIKDAEGNELGMLRDISQLDDQSRRALKVILEKIYFMPRITGILAIEEEYGVSRWDVETEKGLRSFDIRSRRRDVRLYDNGRVIIHDIDGNRYEITDYRNLDKRSQKILSSEI